MALRDATVVDVVVVVRFVVVDVVVAVRFVVVVVVALALLVVTGHIRFSWGQ